MQKYFIILVLFFVQLISMTLAGSVTYVPDITTALPTSTTIEASPRLIKEGC